MSKKKILVLGGCGYIGSVLCPYLKRAGYDIDVVDLCWFGNSLPDDIPVKQMDIFNLQPEDVAPYDAIIFLAGLSNDPMAEFSPKANFIYNTALPAYIGYIAKDAGVKRMLFASSCSVYGYTHNRTFTEQDIAVSNYPYGVSKLQGEQTLLAIADENFSVLCFRQGTVSGYSPRMRLDLAMNTMFKNALHKGEITLSNNKIWRPVLGLNDLCVAYHNGIEAMLNGGHIFNISSFNATIGELALSVVSFIKEKYGTDISVKNLEKQDYRNYKVSTDKAKQLLNFNPLQNDLDILSDLHEHVDLFRDFDDEKYYNINVFQKIMLSDSLTLTA